MMEIIKQYDDLKDGEIIETLQIDYFDESLIPIEYLTSFRGREPVVDRLVITKEQAIDLANHILNHFKS